MADEIAAPRDKFSPLAALRSVGRFCRDRQRTEAACPGIEREPARRLHGVGRTEDERLGMARSAVRCSTRMVRRPSRRGRSNRASSHG